jgi:hypothetical protein
MVKMIAAGKRIWPCKGHYMGFNLGVFLQIKHYKGTNFGVCQSDNSKGPDLPANVYSGRISYVGENSKGGGPALFFAEREAGYRGSIFFETCLALVADSRKKFTNVFEH